MSNGFDVLAELRGLALLSPVAQQMHDIVDELIQADKDYDHAKYEHDELASYDESGMYVPVKTYQRMEAARVRRAAALARVTGADK